jgi:hypothetical protein
MPQMQAHGHPFTTIVIIPPSSAAALDELSRSPNFLRPPATPKLHAPPRFDRPTDPPTPHQQHASNQGHRWLEAAGSVVPKAASLFL